jgi:protease I
VITDSAGPSCALDGERRDTVSGALEGKRIAFLVANAGVEQVELTRPWEQVKQAGGEPVLIAPEKSEVQAMNGDIEKGDTFTPDLAVTDVDTAEFDGLVLPGGVANPDKLRTDSEAVALVKSFASAGKPIAAICHGPWTLIEAGAVQGKTLTSWPSLQTDLRNAGATWEDHEVVQSDEGGYPLVTSRNPDDLDAFNDALTKLFA